MVLVTCTTWPDPSESDRHFAAALRARGCHVEASPWNGPFEPFTGADAIVVRSAWDYHEAPDDYRAWLARLDAERTFNHPALIRWNLAKTHVLELGARGARVPRTLEVSAEPSAIAAALDSLGLDEAVIKPVIGASGFGVERLTRATAADALARAQSNKRTDRVLVQEFLAGIADGELACIFFDAVFSHVCRRVPAPGEFRINSRYGGRMIAAEVPSEVIAQMASVIAMLPQPALYARVDGVLQDGRFVLMEVEVNEPGLGLDLAPGSADRFADALLARLRSLDGRSPAR